MEIHDDKVVIGCLAFTFGAILGLVTGVAVADNDNDTVPPIQEGRHDLG